MIEPRFEYNDPDQTKQEKYNSIREQASELSLTMEKLCHDSRELEWALSFLEMAVMWANKGISREAGL